MTVWVVPEDSWQLDEATAGDVLLRPQADAVVVARVTESGAEWLGPAPEGSLELAPVQSPTQAEGLSESDLEPLLTALSERGA